MVDGRLVVDDWRVEQGVVVQEFLPLWVLAGPVGSVGVGSGLLLGLLGGNGGMVGDLLWQVRDTGLAGPPPHAILR